MVAVDAPRDETRKLLDERLAHDASTLPETTALAALTLPVLGDSLAEAATAICVSAAFCGVIGSGGTGFNKADGIGGSTVPARENSMANSSPLMQSQDMLKRPRPPSRQHWQT